MRTLAALFIFSMTVLASAQTQSVVGRWKTIDDNTGEAKSIVEIFADGEEIKGRVAELIDPKEPNPTCTKCDGAKKDRPVVGLEIIWGMKRKKDGEWAGGKILDPKNGKTYSCKLKLKADGKELEVRGFLGFSLLGRSQTWHRQ